MTFTELRVQYPEFVFCDTSVGYADGRLHLSYHFAITGLGEFHPRWEIPCQAPDLNDPALLRLCEALGLAELVSYWKITCSPTVRLPFPLTRAQQDWWKQLYFGGLGEFFYRNGIETDIGSFMQFQCADTGADQSGPAKKTALSGKLIPVGGGKDSIVTLNLLKAQLSDAFAYQINHRDSAEQSAILAGIPQERILEPVRTLDPFMLACNRRGFLNGHTPFSAIVAFSSVLTAYLNGLGTVILSNESSASESTVSEAEVNHQYSKSYQFERDFFAYERDFLRAGVRYFSLLRPLTEFQIARYFAQLPAQYHRVFRSCNAGNAGGSRDMWCGHCAKCLFVTVILSPFLPYARLKEYLGADLLNDPDAEQWLMELCGALPNKPFECVGNRREVNIAVCLCIARMEQQGEPLPLLYQHYKASALYAEYAAQADAAGQEWDEQHNLPAALAALVRRECVERFR